MNCAIGWKNFSAGRKVREFLVDSVGHKVRGSLVDTVVAARDPG